MVTPYRTSVVAVEYCGPEPAYVIYRIDAQLRTGLKLRQNLFKSGSYDAG